MLDFSHIRWLDDKGRVKPPLTLYIVLAFLARSWCVFAMSLTQSGQRDVLVKLFYPEKTDFISGLVAGSIAVVIFFLITFERRGKPTFLIPLFKRIKWGLFVTLVAEVYLIYVKLSHLQFQFSWQSGLEVLGLFWCWLFIIKSQHLEYYVKNWTLDRE
ncbi:DUF2919 domain-containing protein [Parashewanella tropica]|uniref:DUF2919 domain-containing protein n=1 Tax=Parashewanella tropica TaxID=2547970 RepID=UPI00105A74A3|nr:DUF2919 domain-containing protein [Parashewanella tropica]